MVASHLSVNAGYVHTFSQPINQYYLTSGTGFSTRTGGLDGLRLALNYQFVPNTIVDSVSYDYDHYGSGNTYDPANPPLGLDWRNRDEHMIGVHVGYQLP